MASAAQRYAAAKKRGGQPALAEFARGFDFALDPFQVAACEALEDGHGVLVAAPTGAGKTIVGEFAVFQALRTGGKCFYTTPIKALSNQKFHDLVQRHGAANVGLLTGDNSVNGEAPVVVMTTEVLRNMLYAGSPTLRGLSAVVMDEVHYLAGRFRGPVWGDVILHRPGSRIDVPSRPEVVETLDRAGLLPAIVFIFSRAGCDAAVLQCLRRGLRLTDHQERARIRAVLDDRVADIPDDDLRVLGYAEFADALDRGVAAHHAGMLPVFKEVVETLFSEGLVKVVFATETLALGINMPARSVVLESLVKWNGEAHVDLTPGEYTQLTGRAGRRGIDVEGHGVVLWTPGFDPKHVAGLASTRTYPLRSSFRPSYNMAVNLVQQMGRASARELLEASFAQFQADRAVVGLSRQVKRNQEALEGYREAMQCHLGDFEEYAGLRRALKDRESQLAREGAAQRRASAASSLERLKTGDVIRVPAGRRQGLAVVIDPSGAGPIGDPKPVVVTADRQVKRLAVVDFPTPVEPLAHVRLPKGFSPRSPQARRDLVSSLRNLGLDADGARSRRPRAAAADDDEITALRVAIRRHPCHGCADREQHARWAERHEIGRA